MCTCCHMCVCVCRSVYSPQPQTAQAPTNLHTHFCTWPKHSAAPALAGDSQGSTKKREGEEQWEAAWRKAEQRKATGMNSDKNKPALLWWLSHHIYYLYVVGCYIVFTVIFQFLYQEEMLWIKVFKHEAVYVFRDWLHPGFNSNVISHSP